MISRRASTLGAIGTLVLASAACSDAECPKPTNTAITAPMPVPQLQRESTIMIQAAMPDEVKQRFMKRVVDSKVIPDEWGKVGIGWSSRGSGFFVKAGPKNDKYFAITNKHVVEGATSVTIKLTKNIFVTDANVVYTDDHHDIAIVALPDETPPGVVAAIHFVTLASRSALDNEAIHASGYPRVGEDQSYRLTTGTVSNAGFKFRHEGRDEPFIQHTAAIDHGSSGGPLFTEKTLEVLGMNTLSIPMDENLYCAVPSTMLKEAIENALHAPAAENFAASKTQINDTCKNLVQELGVGGETPEHTSSILSDAVVSDLGVDAWEKAFAKDEEHPDRAAMARLQTSIKQARAMTYLRPILLSHMYNEFKELGQGACTESAVLDSDLKDYTAQKQVRQRVDFSKGGFRTFYWKLEQGHWRLNKYD